MNILAIVLAAVSVFVLGGFWYSPSAFLKTWTKEMGNPKKKDHGARPFIVSFFMSLVSAALFARFVPFTDLRSYILASLVIGFGWVFTSFTINYQFGGKSVNLLLIDGGYHVFQFLIYGLILGLWR